MFILFQYIIYKILLDTLLSIATLENVLYFIITTNHLRH